MDENEQISVLRPPYDEIDALLKAEEKPLPQPRYLDREVVGKAIRFSEIEAVLVVYVDAKYRGDTVSIRGVHGMPGRIKWDVSEKQEIILRGVNGTTMGVALFPHIPMFTKDYDRRRHPNLKNRVIEVSFMFRYDAPQEYGTRILVETVTLTAGEVTDLDWRGKKGQKYDDYQAREYDRKEASEARRRASSSN